MKGEDRSEQSPFWTPLSKGRLRCEVCPRHCQLSDQQIGFCGVRQGRPDKIALLSYGRTSGLAVDPIEKKPLYHFLPGSTVLSFGSAGCNLACRFCQNWNLVQAKELLHGGTVITAEQIVAYAKAQRCPSVAFTYNEPIISIEYVLDCARECHRASIRTVAVTNGYIAGKVRPIFFKEIDAANVDLKAFSADFYSRFCSGSLQAVLDTLTYLVNETDVWLEITNLLIPGENDHDQQLEKLTDWIAKQLGLNVPLHFSAFHPAFKMGDYPPTSLDRLERAREIAISKGLNYVYLGNVNSSNSSSTFCCKCRKPVIVRNGHAVLKKSLRADGCCEFCGAVQAGIFS